MKKTKTLLLLLMTTGLGAFAKEDTAYVNKLIAESKALLGSDQVKAIQVAEQAKQVALRIDYPKGEALALKNIGVVYYFQQKYPEALEQFEAAAKLFETAQDENGVSNMLNNIAGIYKAKGVDNIALDYALRALKIAEKTGDKLRLSSALGTIAGIYHNKRDPKALDYLLRALAISENEGKPVLLANIGEVNFDLGESVKNRRDSAQLATAYFDKAFSYYTQSIQAQKDAVSTAFAHNGIGKVYFKQGKFNNSIISHNSALAIAAKHKDKWNQFKACQGMANAYVKLGKNSDGIEHYNKALTFIEVGNNPNDVAILYKDMSSAYKLNGDLENSLAYQEKYGELQKVIWDKLHEEEMGRLDLTFTNEKKEAQVNLLTKQRKIEQQAKYGFAGGLFFILLISALLFRNYKEKVRTNKLLDKQKVQIEGLLLNILPAEVAKELQHTGKATPKHYDDVTVLFSDFKGFTTIADKMSPTELVSQLNHCFMAFDNIVEKYGLEKIKTIGDAYMCAGGIPMPDATHHLKIVKAAIEMQNWVINNNELRKHRGLEPWDIRIGVHNGPLVAGVVGKKKYAYDIWGSTVNIASRMESNGEPGRVNISSAAYENVKDHYNCTYRGKIYAKNVGEIDMYFIDEEKSRVYAGEKEFELSGV